MTRSVVIGAVAAMVVLFVALPVLDEQTEAPPESEPRPDGEASSMYPDLVTGPGPADVRGGAALATDSGTDATATAPPAVPGATPSSEQPTWLAKIPSMHRQDVHLLAMLAWRCAARSENLPEAAILALAARIGADSELARTLVLVLRDHRAELGHAYGPLAQAGRRSGNPDFIGPHRVAVLAEQRGPSDAEQLRSALSSDDSNHRVDVMRRLDERALTSDPALRARLEAIVRDATTDDRLRSATILALSRVADPRTEALLLDRYAAADAPERADILRRLTRFPPTLRLTRTLLDALNAPESLAIQRFAVSALTRHTSIAARDALVRALDSADEATRRSAVIALRDRVDDPVVRGALEVRRTREMTPNIRSRIERMLR